MANTYSQIYIQTVFTAKYRQAMIDMRWKDEWCHVVGNLINEAGCQSLIVNGVEDHIHCFFRMPPSVCISDVMQSAKAKSSKWINETGYLKNRFEWQRGFGAFSYTQAHKENVINYIKRQEEHHKRIKFLDKYKQLLEQNEVEYDEAYIFTEPMEYENKDSDKNN